MYEVIYLDENGDEQKISTTVERELDWIVSTFKQNNISIVSINKNDKTMVELSQFMVAAIISEYSQFDEDDDLITDADEYNSIIVEGTPVRKAPKKDTADLNYKYVVSYLSGTVVKQEEFDNEWEAKLNLNGKKNAHYRRERI